MSLIKDSSSYIIEPHHILSYDSRKANGELPVMRIGKRCSIAHNCTFVASHHLMDRFTTSGSGNRNLFPHQKGNTSSYSKGDIIIKNDVWIGANCTLIDGITIGNGAVIAAGAVVTKDVAPYSIVGGNPAKLIKYRFPPELIKDIEEANIWDLSLDEISKFDIFSQDIEDLLCQVKKYKQTKGLKN